MRTWNIVRLLLLVRLSRSAAAPPGVGDAIDRTVAVGLAKSSTARCAKPHAVRRRILRAVPGRDESQDAPDRGGRQ
jgi:hypothetical protein